jgi:hypothetical protein
LAWIGDTAAGRAYQSSRHDGTKPRMLAGCELIAGGELPKIK